LSTDENEPDDELEPEPIPEDATAAGAAASARALMGGKLIDLPIEDELKGSYLTYAMSVIVSRALPDVRDGLKPSQRRILVAMNDLNLRPGAQRVKCAKISGDTSGNYHPHGEMVIYPTLVRMAQEWNMRHVLVDKQGNFGSIAGMPAAAMRYTEARLSPIAAMLLDDLDLDTVDFTPTYDDSRREPTVLPSKFPNLLVNGANGIAVGMATSIPPHNLGEVCDALEYRSTNCSRFVPVRTFPPAASSVAARAFVAATTRAAARSSCARGPASKSLARIACGSWSARCLFRRLATGSKSGSPSWSTKTKSRASRRCAMRAISRSRCA
jgi:hypothetical protein